MSSQITVGWSYIMQVAREAGQLRKEGKDDEATRLIEEMEKLVLKPEVTIFMECTMEELR